MELPLVPLFGNNCIVLSLTSYNQLLSLGLDRTIGNYMTIIHAVIELAIFCLIRDLQPLILICRYNHN
jgi:hypothetical protein